MSQSRQLAAIMFTDIVGYTSLMGKDEQTALSLLSQNRAIHKKYSSKYGGNLVKELGDGFLLYFSSALDAVNCASEIQIELENVKSLRLRIGIHLGDTIFRDNDIFGDGVNLASRVQSIAKANEVLMTEAVYKNILNHNEIECAFYKNAKFKNIPKPTRVYKLIKGANGYRLEERKIPFLTKYMLIGIFLIVGLVFTINQSSSDQTLLTKASFINEFNQKESLEFFTDNHEIKIGISRFTNINQIDSLNWLIYGIRGLVQHDLEFGDLINCPTFYIDLTNDPISNILDDSSWDDLDYFLMGSISSLDSSYLIFAKFYDRSGRILFDEKIKMHDEYKLIDTISSLIYENIQIPAGIEFQLDYPIKNITTNNVEAFKLYGSAKGHPVVAEKRYVRGYAYSFDKVIEMDSSFAGAYLEGGGIGLSLFGAYLTYQKGLEYRKRLRPRDQLRYLLYYNFTKGDTAASINIAEEILERNPHSYLRIDAALNFLMRFPQFYEKVKSKSLELYEELDFQDKLLLFDKGTLMLDKSLIQIIEDELNKDPLNFSLNERLLNVLYATDQIELARKHLLKMISIFPEHEDALKSLSEILDNKGRTDFAGLNGTFTSNGKWSVKLFRNSNNTLFWRYNERLGTTRALFELDQNHFFVFSSGNLQLVEIIRSSNESVLGIRSFINGKPNAKMHYIPEGLKRIVDNYSYNGSIIVDRDSLRKLKRQFKELPYLSGLDQNLDYLSRGNIKYKNIIGIYDRGIKIFEKNGRIIKNGVRRGETLINFTSYLLPLDDSTFMSNELLSKRISLSRVGNKTGYIGWMDEDNLDSTNIWYRESFVEKID